MSEETKVYAGIGSRGLTEEEWNLCHATGFWLATQGWHLKTGAAKGADQAFAEGAIQAGGKVTLCLPWPSYQKGWRNQQVRGAVKSVTLQYWHKEAYASVEKHHPAPERLKDVGRMLHARNYLIVENTAFVLAFPKTSKWGGLGGTGQGIRVAADMGIQVIRLDEPFDRKRVEDKVLPKK